MLRFVSILVVLMGFLSSIALAHKGTGRCSELLESYRKSKRPVDLNELIKSVEPLMHRYARSIIAQSGRATPQVLYEDILDAGRMAVIDVVTKRFDSIPSDRFLPYLFSSIRKAMLSRFYRQVHKEPSGGNAAEYVLISREPDPAFDVINREFMEALSVAMSRMTEREETIIRYRTDGKTLDEIGRLLGISRQRVQQIQDRARAKLQRYLSDWKEGLYSD